jgi:phosphatidylglycerol---prolipoprotein diacylglyceryl transferase
MHPVCFTIGSHTIYWYGVMMAAAFLICVIHLNILAKKDNFPPSTGSDFAFWLMVGGIIGARLGYVVLHLSFYIKHPLDIIRVDKGGLVFYGGVICAIISAVIFTRIKKQKFWRFADYGITALPLGHAVGRIGCFLNGCCYGTPSDLPWSIYLHNAFRHPAQIYSVFGNLLIYLILMRFYRKKKYNGQVFALYLILYPTFRFFLEFVRADKHIIYPPFTVGQAISLALIITGFILWLCVFRTPANSNNGKND